MDQENKNKKKISPQKRRYLSVLLFLVFAACSFCVTSSVKAQQSEEQYMRIMRQMVEKNDVNIIKNYAAGMSSASEGYTSQYNAAMKNLEGPGTMTKFFIAAFNWLLYAVLRFLGVIVIVAGILFDWVIDSRVFLSIMNMRAIVTGWTTVRDFLNLAFILMLLFSAFCTIFQVDKYNLKKVLLTLVIMALLVNFSFPIARFIIDAANVPMYFFLNNIRTLGNAGSQGASIANWSNITSAVFPPGTEITGDYDITLQLIAAIIFLFIFTITLLILAVLLVIRMLVLAILIIFSPVGFVAAIFKGTAVAGYADKWWNSLFKQAFFGPIVAFMIYLATLIMSEFNMNQMTRGSNLPLVSSLVRAGIQMALPIVLLWLGIIAAQQMGAIGATAAMKQGTNAINWGRKLPWRGVKAGGRGIKAGARATGIPGAVSQKWGNFKSGFTSAREAREAKYAGMGPFKVPGAAAKDMLRKSEEYKKNHESIDSLKQKASNGDSGAAHRLADMKELDEKVYMNFVNKNKDPNLEKIINGKLKESRLDVVINYRINKETEDMARNLAGGGPVTDVHRNQARLNIATEELGKLSPTKWKEQDLDSMFKYDPADASSVARFNARKQAAQNVYGGYTPENQAKVKEDMRGDRYAAGHSVGLW